jgi:hypothetical protein
MAGFSRLAPRTHVKPHVGWTASVYRLHLALVVPPGCRLRFASESRSWQEGRCLNFDDTGEHEAWNDSEFLRGVLLLDFLRPGFSGSVADHVPEKFGSMPRACSQPRPAAPDASIQRTRRAGPAPHRRGSSAEPVDDRADSHLATNRARLSG